MCKKESQEHPRTSWKRDGNVKASYPLSAQPGWESPEELAMFWGTGANDRAQDVADLGLGACQVWPQGGLASLLIFIPPLRENPIFASDRDLQDIFREEIKATPFKTWHRKSWFVFWRKKFILPLLRWLFPIPPSRIFGFLTGERISQGVL